MTTGCDHHAEVELTFRKHAESHTAESVCLSECFYFNGGGMSRIAGAMARVSAMFHILVKGEFRATSEHRTTTTMTMATNGKMGPSTQHTRLLS